MPRQHCDWLNDLLTIDFVDIPRYVKKLGEEIHHHESIVFQTFNNMCQCIIQIKWRDS